MCFRTGSIFNGGKYKLDKAGKDLKDLLQPNLTLSMDGEADPREKIGLSHSLIVTHSLFTQQIKVLVETE